MTKKKKSNNGLKNLVIFLLLVLVIVWGLVACQKGEISFYKDKNNKGDNQEEAAGQVKPIEESSGDLQEEPIIEEPTEEEPIIEEVAEEEPTVEEQVLEEEQQSSMETAQGSDFQDNFDQTVETSTLPNQSISWSFKRNGDHSSVTGYSQGIDLVKYSAYYKVDTQEKVLYLTFDEGYENGHTSKILDILKSNDVQAAFFVTKPYITSNPDLCIRMKEEGHVVANHSVTHSKFSTLSDQEIEQELVETAQTFEDVTGYAMDNFFRPPAGEFSERVLFSVRKANYKTIFWSMAYQDWLVDDQPGKQAAYDHVMANYHPGSIILLHAVSRSNTEALDDIIKALKDKGYRFASLYEVE